MPAILLRGLGPWERRNYHATSDLCDHVRRNALERVVALYNVTTSGRWYWDAVGRGHCDTEAEARTAADADLRANGYVLAEKNHEVADVDS
jgi:hypothetical protein